MTPSLCPKSEKTYQLHGVRSAPYLIIPYEAVKKIQYLLLIDLSLSINGQVSHLVSPLARSLPA